MRDLNKFFTDHGKKRWEGVSAEERSRQMKAIRAKGNPNRWANKTEEERKAHSKKMLEAKKKKYENKS